MKIDMKQGEAVISGYVNAVGRDSRLIPSARGPFVEQVQPGAFGDALRRAKNVDLLVNHDRSRVLGRTDNGSLRLCEDNVGLYAELSTSDPQTVEQARRGEFRGWSFEFRKRKGGDAWEATASGTPRRILKDFDISEVSLIDKKKLPVYIGTTVEVRAAGEEPESGERRFMEDFAAGTGASAGDKAAPAAGGAAVVGGAAAPDAGSAAAPDAGSAAAPDAGDAAAADAGGAAVVGGAATPAAGDAAAPAAGSAAATDAGSAAATDAGSAAATGAVATEKANSGETPSTVTEEQRGFVQKREHIAKKMRLLRLRG